MAWAIKTDIAFGDDDEFPTLDSVMRDLQERHAFTWRVAREHGPAGGWPEVELRAETLAALHELAVEIQGGDVEQAEYELEYAYEVA